MTGADPRHAPALWTALAFAGGILVLDVYTPQEMPPQYLYVLCILLTVWSPHERTLWGMTTLCTFLTALGAYLSPPTYDFYIVLFNRSIAVILFLATALLVRAYRRAHERLRGLNLELEARVEDRTRELSRAFEEREQLNRDLHDNVLQSLYAIGLRLEAGRSTPQADAGALANTIAQAVDQLKVTMKQIRAYIAGPHAAHDDRLPLDTALPALINSMTLLQGPQFCLTMDPNISDGLSPEQTNALLLVVREALSNCVRHAHANQGTVTAQRRNGALRIEIRDDGIGFDPAVTHQGPHGLTNMNARARTIGADLRVNSAPGQGTSITLTLPLPQGSSRA